MGTVPADKTPPRFHASAAERSLQRLAEECRADRDCAQKFGDVDANLDAMLARARSTPGLTPETVMEKLRTWLYAPETRAHVPARLQRAAQGDFGDFTAPAPARAFADGLYLSITCAETFGEIDADAAIEAARATRFGAYRLERQRAACERWPRAARDPKLLRPDASRLPVLFITGELDPVAPTSWTLELAPRFPASKVAVAPRGAHVFDGLSGQDTCLDATLIRLFDTGDARGLDVSCFAAMTPQPAGFLP